MDSLEVNKVFAAVLTAGLVFAFSGFIAQTLVHPERLKESAIKIEGAEAPAAAAGGAPQQEQLPPIAPLLVSANAGAGEADTKKLCVSCHTFTEGGKAGVGPNLYGVIGKPHGHMEGFAYSNALKSKQGPWTYDELNEWLKSPRSYAPGTKMSFAGISNDKERADVIAYLRSLSPNPEPLPDPNAQPAAAPAAQGAAPAAQGAAPAAGNAASAQEAGGTRPSQNAAPTTGPARPQPGRVTGPAGTAQAQGQQNSQPSANQSGTQMQTDQSQQAPQARQNNPTNSSGTTAETPMPASGATTPNRGPGPEQSSGSGTPTPVAPAR